MPPTVTPVPDNEKPLIADRGSIECRIIRGKKIKEPTILLQLDSYFPECFYFQRKNQQLPTLVCLQDDSACDKVSVCLEPLARRSQNLLETVENCRLLVAFFARRTDRDRQFALLVPAGMKRTRVVTCNPRSAQLVWKRGEIAYINLSTAFWKTSIPL